VKAVVIACQTLQDELRLAIKETGVDYPVIYVESGLHNKPELLHGQIQVQLDMIDNVDVILMVFGYCGNSMLGIKASHCKIVIPRVDDCISLLLGSAEARRRTSQEGTYYLTKGWLDNEQNIIGEYERCVARYGEVRTLRLMKTMLSNYCRFMLIDTGAYSLASIIPRTQEFAAKLNLRHEIIKGSPRLLRKLLLSSWDEEFIVLEPGQEITLAHICSSNVSSQLAIGLS
jgi:hypothetical protein